MICACDHQKRSHLRKRQGGRLEHIGTCQAEGCKPLCFGFVPSYNTEAWEADMLRIHGGGWKLKRNIPHTCPEKAVDPPDGMTVLPCQRCEDEAEAATTTPTR
jgi:hypothetical protein